MPKDDGPTNRNGRWLQPVTDNTWIEANDLDAERAVLGACLINPTKINDVRLILTDDDWYEPRHATIWRRLIELADTGTPIDVITFNQHLGTDTLRTIGGSIYLHDLLRAVPVPDNAGHYAKTVRDTAILRHLQVTGHRIHAAAAHGDITRAAETLQHARTELDVAAAVLDHTAPTTPTTIDGATFILNQPKEIPAIWGHGEQILWAEGEALMICGPQGVGKTTLAGQILYARLGLLDRVLDFPLQPTASRVLYLACDRPAQIARSLSRGVHEQWGDTLREKLFIWKGPPPDDFAKHPLLLREMCLKAKADTVFIDSLKDVAIGLTDDTVGASYNRARQFAVAAGIQVIELHHQTKRGAGGQGEPKTLADVYGSVWLTSGAGSVLLLWGDAGDPIVQLRHLKQPAEEVGPLRVSHDHNAGVSEVSHSVDLVKLAAQSRSGLSARDAAVAMFDTVKPTTAQVEKARRKLDRLVNDQLMHRVDGSRGGGGDRHPTTYWASHREDK
jgi:replicative DNA helicase